MIGNIIIWGVTWLLLRLINKNLFVLAGTSFLFGLLLLIAGFMATAFLAGGISAVIAWIANFTWEPTTGLGIGFLANGLYKTFNSVLFEELIFRGVLLFMAIRWLGEKKANLVSAVSIGVYHWFTFNIIGNPVLMVWILFYTGLWGLMLAYAYSRTGTLALPIGLHWGWNFVDQIIFNKQGGGFFKSIITMHSRYLNMMENMLYINFPAIAFAVIVIVLLYQYASLKVKPWYPDPHI